MNALSEYRYLGASECTRTFSHEWLAVQSVRLDQQKKNTEEVLGRQYAKMQEVSRYSSLGHLWTLAHKISTTLFSSLSMGLGVMSMSAGGSLPAGCAMVAGGALHLANTCFAEHGVWEWAARKFVAEEEAHKWATLLSGSASGTLFLYSLFTQAHGISLHESGRAAVDLLTKALSSAEAIALLGKGRVDALRKWMEADLRQLKMELSSHQEDNKLLQHKLSQWATALKTEQMQAQQMVAIVTRPQLRG